MKSAVVTGASSGIGLAVSKYLNENGYRVYGIARDFSKSDYKNKNFLPVSCDVMDLVKLEKTSKEILRQENKRIDILINNAGIAYFAPHEEIKVSEIAQMVQTNLTAPLVLTRLFLRSLKKTEGYLINITSVTAEIRSKWGGTYAATKAGLQHFSNILFEDVRKSGVKVVTIMPDMTDTPFYDHLSFKPDDHEAAHLTPEDVVEALDSVLNRRTGSVITQITLRPQLHRIEKRKRKK
ncbi:MAG TPA: SDR family oxidoreductase [Balneolales bacterium]|nr:SDR family oxidoreductase [Balneolales bacterium]